MAPLTKFHAIHAAMVALGLRACLSSVKTNVPVDMIWKQTKQVACYV